MSDLQKGLAGRAPMSIKLRAFLSALFVVLCSLFLVPSIAIAGNTEATQVSLFGSFSDGTNRYTIPYTLVGIGTYSKPTSTLFTITDPTTHASTTIYFDTYYTGTTCSGGTCSDWTTIKYRGWTLEPICIFNCPTQDLYIDGHDSAGRPTPIDDSEGNRDWTASNFTPGDTTILFESKSYIGTYDFFRVNYSYPSPCITPPKGPGNGPSGVCPTVPEPKIWIYLLVGVGLVGAALRGRDLAQSTSGS